MNAQIYLYRTVYIKEDGSFVERYGLVAAADLPTAAAKLAEEYSNLDEIQITQCNYAPIEINEDYYNYLFHS